MFTDISDIINAPIFLVIIGGILIFLIQRYFHNEDKKSEEVRNQRLLLKEKQIFFLDEIAISLHNIFPLLFEEINNQKFDFQKKLKLNDEKINLFKIRFSVFVKSKAYFGKEKGENFSQRFDILINNIDDIITLLGRAFSFIEEQDIANLKKCIETIMKEIKELQAKWIIDKKEDKEITEDIKKFTEKDLDNINDLIHWLLRATKHRTVCVWLRSLDLLEKTLEEHKITDNN